MSRPLLTQKSSGAGVRHLVARLRDSHEKMKTDTTDCSRKTFDQSLEDLFKWLERSDLSMVYMERVRIGFAEAALSGICSQIREAEFPSTWVAKTAWDVSGAMMEEMDQLDQ